jgi:hypothetical protein
MDNDDKILPGGYVNPNPLQQGAVRRRLVFTLMVYMTLAMGAVTMMDAASQISQGSDYEPLALLAAPLVLLVPLAVLALVRLNQRAPSVRAETVQARDPQAEGARGYYASRTRWPRT